VVGHFLLTLQKRQSYVTGGGMLNGRTGSSGSENPFRTQGSSILPSPFLLDSGNKDDLLHLNFPKSSSSTNFCGLLLFLQIGNPFLSQYRTNVRRNAYDADHLLKFHCKPHKPLRHFLQLQKRSKSGRLAVMVTSQCLSVCQ
jgi:hypothetical protein